MGTVSTTATPTSGHTTHLQFEYSPDQINSICQKQIEILKGKIEKIAQLKPNDCTFSSTALELEKVTRDFGNNLNPILFLKYVSPSNEIREAADKCENEVQQLFVEIYTRSDLFSSFKSAEKQMSSLPEKDKKLFEESLLSFRRNGLDLSEEQRKVFITKKKRLVAIESEFANRLVNETTTLEFSLEELKGLPQSYIESLEKSANGNYKLTMSYPHYYPFMQNAQNSDARKKYEYLFNNRGGDANRALLEEAIQLRSDLSHMLGFKNHSEFVLEQRMAKNPTQVRAFLEDLVRQLQPKAKQELQEMVEEKKKELGLQETQIYAWDWRYYENILRKTKYNIDPQVIKEYFPLEVVLKGMFEVYQTLFEVKFVEEASSEVWHSSVKKYKIQKGQETIAYFFMDLFPRTGKYGHAAAFTLISGFDRDDSTYELPISSIVANFNPPSPENPSLLPHNEVETLFHEFGHIMHQTLTRAKYSAFSGTNVKTDFVEAPSQMLENWVWKKETLQKLSGHYSDPAKKLPEAMIERMIQAKLLNVGIQTLRQLAFSTIDLDYHTSSKVDSTQIYSNRMNEIMLIPIQQGTQPQSSFGHLMGGYDSGYYGYMWSKVFAQDMFTRFEAEGLLNPETGKDYYDWILKPGGEREPLDLITGFLKREPSNKAFLKSIGL
ncbi:MAG: M3 family metallopeptidase [Deltaproteobacteria bacterium]